MLSLYLPLSGIILLNRHIKTRHIITRHIITRHIKTRHILNRHIITQYYFKVISSVFYKYIV